MKGVIKFVNKGNLIHRYVGPYCILKRVSNVTDELVLPTKLAVVYLFFQIFKEVYGCSNVYCIFRKCGCEG